MHDCRQKSIDGDDDDGDLFSRRGDSPLYSVARCGTAMMGKEKRYSTPPDDQNPRKRNQTETQLSSN